MTVIAGQARAEVVGEESRAKKNGILQKISIVNEVAEKVIDLEEIGIESSQRTELIADVNLEARPIFDEIVEIAETVGGIPGVEDEVAEMIDPALSHSKCSK